MSGTQSDLATEYLVRDVLGGGAGRAALTVVSTSMRPRLEEGDRIVVKRIMPRRLWPGDMIVFSSETAGLVVHRLIWRDPPLGRPRRIFTKGDALGYLDRAITTDQVLGRVSEIVRGGNRLKPTTLADRVRCWWQAAGYGARRWVRHHLRTALPAE